MAGALFQQGVVGPTKPARRNILRRKAICSWLAHQPINHMTIIDVVFVAAAEPGKSLDQHRAVPHLQAFDLDMDITKFADQLAGH